MRPFKVLFVYFVTCTQRQASGFPLIPVLMLSQRLASYVAYTHESAINLVFLKMSTYSLKNISEIKCDFSQKNCRKLHVNVIYSHKTFIYKPFASLYVTVPENLLDVILIILPFYHIFSNTTNANTSLACNC